MTMLDAAKKTNGHAEPTRAWEARIEQRLAALATSGEQRVLALREAMGELSIRFHDLRHSHATHLLASGVHPKIASERLGHATVALTLDTYSHVIPGMQEDAVARIDAAFAGAVKPSGKIG
jgi:integrase